MTEYVITPPRPYALTRSAASGACPTRRLAGGVLHLTLDAEGGPGWARVRQRPDGALQVDLHAEELEPAMAMLRRCLAVDVDLTPFLGRVRDDPVLGPLTRRHRGVRPLPIMSAAHALLRGVTGQLVRQRDARDMEFAAVRAVGRPLGRLWLALRPEELRRVPLPVLSRAGMSERRAVALLRAARALPLDGLHALPTRDVVRRLCAQPGLGPWTAGVVCTDGLGRLDHGPVGDLGLMRMLAFTTGRTVTVDECGELLDRYAPYQALAAHYLLRGAAGTGLPASPQAVAREVRRRR